MKGTRQRFTARIWPESGSWQWVDRETGEETPVICFHDYPDNVQEWLICYTRKAHEDRTSQVPGDGKLAARMAVHEMFMDGRIKLPKAGGFFVVSAEVEAVYRLKRKSQPGISLADVQKALRQMADEDRDALLDRETVQDMAAKIRAEREAQDDEGGLDLTDI